VSAYLGGQQRGDFLSHFSHVGRMLPRREGAVFANALCQALSWDVSGTPWRIRTGVKRGGVV
jgi:hypothetical protein